MRRGIAWAALALLLTGCGGEETRTRQPLSLAEAPWAAACVDCHPSETRAWLGHAMADTLGPLDADRMPAEPADEWVLNPASGAFYRVEGNEAGWRIVEEHDAPGSTRRSMELAWRIGAGVRDMAFVARDHGRWQFSPLEFYTGLGWASAPFEFGAHPAGLRQPVTPDCLSCHTTRELPNPYPYNDLGDLEPVGLDCGACHGPVEEHVRRMEADEQGDPAILNPADLVPGRQLDLCARCHLEGDARIPLTAAGHTGVQPGDDLLQERAVLVGREPGDDFSFVSQARRLALSECFQASTDMTCQTCHDPHTALALDQPAGTQAACVSCHEGPHRPVAGGEPPPRQRACADCHMRVARPFDLPHGAVTDHWIRSFLPPAADDGMVRHNESGDSDWVLFKWRPTDPDRLERDAADALLAQALIHGGQVSRSTALFDLLPPAGSEDARTGPILELAPTHFMRGRAYASSGRPADAEQAYRDALALDPEMPEASMNLAWHLLERGQTAEARALASRVASRHPRAENPWRLLGAAALAEDDVRGAANAWQRSLDRQPDQPRLWHSLADALAAAGDEQGAMEARSEAARRHR